MIEKRFTHKKWYDERQVFDGEEPFAIVDVYNQAETICNKLNELAEENQHLKQFIQELTTKGTGKIHLVNGNIYKVNAILTDIKR